MAGSRWLVPIALGATVAFLGRVPGDGAPRSAPTNAEPAQPAAPVPASEAATRLADPFPAPTEHVLAPDAEKRLEEGRRIWIEEMHRAGPGIDWRAIERQNGLARMEARNRAVRGGGAADAVRGASPWLEIGSRNLAGRMHAAALSGAGDSLYAGSSRGGVWKADLDGNGWRPLSDNLWGGAHGLAVAAGPPETITRITDGGDLHYSDDGGATWSFPAGTLANIVAGIRVLSDPSSPTRVYLIVRKSTAQGNRVKLYRSDDRGQSYALIRTLAGAYGDIWIDRSTGGRLWVLDLDSLVYTDDFGDSWSTAGTIAPGGTVSGAVLAGSEAGAPTFYAALQVGGLWDLYRSTDAGVSWTWRADVDDFWETLASSIGNPDVVMFGGTELWRSTNGGSSFTKVNAWGDYYADPVHKLHADLPGLNAVRTPGGQAIHYISTDGGLYRSDDDVATVTNVSLASLHVSQYYSTHTSVNDPDLVLAGAQDQGYQRANGTIVGTLHDFDQLISGDYGHLTSGDGSHDWVFSVYPGFVLVQRGELAPALTDYLSFPGDQSFSWMPYVLADPTDPASFFFCGNQIVRFRRRPHWLDWVMQFSAQDFTVNGGSYTTALAISAVDTDDRITVTNSGLFWWTADAGTTWAMSADMGPSAHYFYGTALEFSPTVAGEAYAGGSGYSGPAVYRTTDGGVTWSPVGDGLPSTLVYDLAYEGGASPVVYAATESGPYRLDPDTDTWESIDGATAPLTTYWSVEAVPAAGVMRFGTYGRGIWDWQVQSAVSVAELREPAADNGLALLNAPNPFADATTLRFVTRREGSVALRIVDATGRRVRDRARGRREAGTHRVAWDGRDGSGRRVAAGVYFARLETEEGVAVRRMARVK